jgi:hypothetical protein
LDNISQGGICIDIDMDSGMLRKGYTLYKYGHVEYESHPDTNFKFYGTKLPYFREVKELAVAAHKCFPMFALVGWDIAITENGPTIIEGNRVPDLDLYQIHRALKGELSPIISKKGTS